MSLIWIVGMVKCFPISLHSLVHPSTPKIMPDLWGSVFLDISNSARFIFLSFFGCNCHSVPELRYCNRFLWVSFYSFLSLSLFFSFYSDTENNRIAAAKTLTPLEWKPFICCLNFKIPDSKCKDILHGRNGTFSNSLIFFTGYLFRHSAVGSFDVSGKNYKDIMYHKNINERKHGPCFISD